MSDLRNIKNGSPIPSEGYADQPYVIRTDDGAWLCTMTTGRGHEGVSGQHVISLRSTDHGATWEKPVAIEPADGTEASYSVLLKTPYGRVYCFYNHNSDHVREVRREDGGVYTRVDSLGHYVFKYSDDNGRTWSAQRYDVPMREFACDRENGYGGSLRFFWNVGKPLIHHGAAYLVMHKVGAMGVGFFARSEGAFLRSDNLLSERDPDLIRFETLPDGDIGLRTPAGGGRIAEEQSLTALSDGSLFCVYRTVDGWPACSYSRDDGHSWTPPAYLTYSPAGRRVKHPRAANFIWRCTNGRYLYWFHNHGGQFIQRLAKGSGPYEDRNPAWLMAGHEVDTPDGRMIAWSQPEIVLYDDAPIIRMSYPDLIEENGDFWITETQKSIGRVHAISPALVDGLFKQQFSDHVTRDGLVLELKAPSMPAEVAMPPLPVFSTRDSQQIDMRGADTRAGFTLELVITLESLEEGQIVLDSRTDCGEGLFIRTGAGGTLELALISKQTDHRWSTDRGALGTQPGQRHHVVFIVDGGPKVITVVVDGVLCDGGESRQFGWGRFSPYLRDVNGSSILRIGSSLRGHIALVRLYDRAIRTSEAVANCRGASQ